MKKQLTIAFAAVFVLSLAIVAFAYTKTTGANLANAQAGAAAATSCPMQEKNHAATAAAHHENASEKHSCGMENCCQDGKCLMGGACCKASDSCPMKNGERGEDATAVDYSKITHADSGDAKADCCAPGASCCAGGGSACCKNKHS